jgi:flagellar biosynthesis/type III secretory pathway protein FliH
LKQPPMFEGAVVKVSGFDQATGQFNIAFENLAPQAKVLLDLADARASLEKALEQKGYTVHIITATTQLESKIVTASENSGQQQQQFGQDGGRDGQQQGRRQGQRGHEEEA